MVGADKAFVRQTNYPFSPYERIRSVLAVAGYTCTGEMEVCMGED